VTHPTIVSLRTGRVRTFPRPSWDHAPERTWRSAYHKDEVDRPVRVTTLGLEGDEQASREIHGGPHRAVLAYAFAHYAAWRAEPGLERIGPGGFAENLTVDRLDETTVCLGDRYRTGDVVFEVSQPRGPCANIARTWNRPDLVQRVTEVARAGWYMRVLAEGTIARGAALERIARPHPQWTVERLFRLSASAEPAAADLLAAAACGALSPGWRERFTARAAGTR
jgi:MOSC domain-containing protein YiiM